MNDHLFNPLEISICGYSGLGKTKLICKLITALSSKFKIGYVKHDAHRFEMDKKGKDTYEATNSGAKGVCIYSSKSNQMAYLGAKNDTQLSSLFSTYDFVLIEGLKGASSLPKIVFLDSKSAILDEVDPNTILLTVSESERDNIDRIQTALLNYFNSKVSSVPLYGLVLTGGYSKRMGTDKSLLNYLGTPQYQHCLNLLTPYCDQVFLSCRQEQAIHYKESPIITDAFINFGPIGGILSAQKMHPHAAWLVLACDLPKLTSNTLDYLVKNRQPFCGMTAFKNATNNLPEPLCAIYEPKSYHTHLHFIAQGIHCPRKMMIQSEYPLLEPQDFEALDNINTLKEHHHHLETAHE